MNKLRGATQRNKNYTKGTYWDNKSFTVTFNRKKKIKRKIKNIKNKIYLQTYYNYKKKLYTHTHIYTHTPTHILKIQKYIREKDLTWMIIYYI